MALAGEGGAYPQPSRMTRTSGFGRGIGGDCKRRPTAETRRRGADCRRAELRNCGIEKQEAVTPGTRRLHEGHGEKSSVVEIPSGSPDGAFGRGVLRLRTRSRRGGIARFAQDDFEGEWPQL